MIFGYVNQALEAVAKLQIKDSSGVEHDLEAVIDTGYTGRLILPADVVARLNLPYLFEGSAVLADGHSIRLPYHEATIVQNGQNVVIRAGVSGSAPLIGMKLLEGHQLWVEAIRNGNVQIDALP